MFTTHSIHHEKTSQEYKSKDLSSVLEQKINKARLNLISIMIWALCKIKTANYMALANVFDSTANAESSLRRIKRFMADFDLPVKLVSGFIFGILPEKKNLILVPARTNWKFGEANIKYSNAGDLL